jgi:hypothetical protein
MLSSLWQKLLEFWTERVQKMLPLIIAIASLLVLFLIYSYSIFHEQLFLGIGDYAQRFIMAIEYAREPSRAWLLKSWVSIWPPVPFIIDGLVLRFVLFPGMSDVSTGIMAVQLTSVLFVLLGFF